MAKDIFSGTEADGTNIIAGHVISGKVSSDFKANGLKSEQLPTHCRLPLSRPSHVSGGYPTLFMARVMSNDRRSNINR